MDKKYTQFGVRAQALEKRAAPPYIARRELKQTKTVRKLTHEELLARSVPPGEASTRPRTPIAGMLDNIRSLYNVGSMFRTSDGAFVRRLYLCGYTPAPPRGEIDKTALGATATVPWLHFPDPLAALAHARADGMQICVLEHTTKSVPVYDVPRGAFPLCLVVGNELTGVSRAVIEAADMAVEIPMHGVKQSLNAGVAYGVALFELMRILRGVT